jgi:hypothetical protein
MFLGPSNSGIPPAEPGVYSGLSGPGKGPPAAPSLCHGVYGFTSFLILAGTSYILQSQLGSQNALEMKSIPGGLRRIPDHRMCG